jgi:hypothetical protein
MVLFQFKQTRNAEICAGDNPYSFAAAITWSFVYWRVTDGGTKVQSTFPLVFTPLSTRRVEVGFSTGGGTTGGFNTCGSKVGASVETVGGGVGVGVVDDG